MKTQHSDFLYVTFPLLKSIKYQFTGLDTDINIVQIQKMIKELSDEESAVFWEEASQIYQCDTEQVKETYKTLKCSKEIRPPAIFSKQQIPDKIQKTKLLLRATMITVLKQSKEIVPESIADNELCIIVNEFVEKDIQQRFWNKVASMIPAKTKKQIYDFYHNQFSRSMYSNVTKEEQEMISVLNAEYPNEKPSAVAQIFLERTQKNILKRDIIMRLVNLRRYSKQSETERLQ
ncbi:Homeobox-like_domain superfamily [Hexamita inflata]|uniref:Homeobox-like_domain superfamily n=1 Tax=Hexamita inflata TaxID=28002 RepID=A0ABP1GIU4_9EUKA